MIAEEAQEFPFTKNSIKICLQQCENYPFIHNLLMTLPATNPANSDSTHLNSVIVSLFMIQPAEDHLPVTHLIIIDQQK